MNRGTLKIPDGKRKRFDLIQVTAAQTDHLTESIREVAVGDIRLNGETMRVDQIVSRYDRGVSWQVMHGPTQVLTITVETQTAHTTVRPHSSFIDQNIEIDVIVTLSTKANRL